MTWPLPDRLSVNPALSRTPGVDLSSFADFLRRQAPELLPASISGGADPAAVGDRLPHGTTIVALKFPGGVVIAGDRRSTQGNMIAGRDVRKVYITDDYTATGIAGTAAVAVEFARLYAVELEHYEKLEGVPLTFAGKVNRLAIMVRGNLAAAMQGLVALPLLAGYDIHASDPLTAGRIVSFDAAGGWNMEEEGYQAVGSGSLFAKSSMKKLYAQVTDADSALRVAVEALYDAADDDSATGGPDLVRGIFPTAVTIDADGAADVPDSRIAEVAREIIESRSRPDTSGPDTSGPDGGEK
ncbi:proteasome subunit beta [Mycobacterium shinjukuense]|uniref:Proteasome subunit beta n=1 Tax=Mycobacterium shinjukuense TaxID=398694 RepID=A0A7I7MM49_9MYCO|nr:proteasome subunit beta [Mycobacterium shinjukuense]MCV6984843.1 proteasome subunit beta [Mycobacterium shinjukuense]ORB66416.1 proteasome subunit beta [Mycobacterium shinjukuense]BBX73255.1 proteasome subunit beta [Mycobacterium shinjukuense]